MSATRGLALLIVLATTLFIVGTSIEKGDGDHHSESANAEVSHVEGSEEAEEADGEEAHSEEASSSESGEDERVLGIDPESTALIFLAAAFSIALAALVWFRPETRWLLELVAVAMLVFALLDVREVFHQGDESETALAVIAAAVAALHLAAAAWALALRKLAKAA